MIMMIINKKTLNMDFESLLLETTTTFSRDDEGIDRDIKMVGERHDLLSSRVVLSEDDYRRGCERACNLENGFYLDVDNLDPSYKEETDRINLDGSFEVARSRRGEVSDERGIT
nr:hypothetical protein [Tanacetum cinerariifolium]